MASADFPAPTANTMRLAALLFTAILASAPAGAAQSPDTQKETKLADLPVSVDKIRDALVRKPLLTLTGLREQAAHFKIEIEERRKIEELLATLDFKAGPAPPGGIYAYEQQRLLNRSVDNPLTQPWAAFNTGELITLAIENIALKYLGGRALTAVSNYDRARAEYDARQEVARALEDFCAAQPSRGAGLQGGSIAGAVR